YDSLIGKLIAYGENRDAARARLRMALAELVIEGIDTNIALHQDIINDPQHIEAGVSIHYLEEKLRGGSI
ncbi:MAG TPA: acetyl-CoA carboxylase biotin carboxylase subunit, partial [Salinisphaeraceae bacterium]|nr:acetyl-CoA carboxylase biotin carboxylase subunit [Salinisphaeraceae bacterium]